MEQQKENENSVAVRLKRHLGKMSAQVDYLIRNNKLLTQLDIDNLMTNTRELYDMLCSVNANMDVCSIPFEIENDNEDVNESRESRESDYEVEEEDVNEGEDVDVEKEELPAESFELNIEEEEENVNKEEEEEVNDEDDDLIDEDDENENENEDEDLIEEDEAGEDEISDVEDLSDLTEEDVDMFVKELFRGNEERFSKSMAELEEAPTWKAALTHLEEMSIAYGWDYDSPAYQKLVELLERRY